MVVFLQNFDKRESGPAQRTLDQEIQREAEMISFSLMQLRISVILLAGGLDSHSNFIMGFVLLHTKHWRAWAGPKIQISYHRCSKSFGWKDSVPSPRSIPVLRWCGLCGPLWQWPRQLPRLNVPLHGSNVVALAGLVQHVVTMASVVHNSTPGIRSVCPKTMDQKSPNGKNAWSGMNATICSASLVSTAWFSRSPAILIVKPLHMLIASSVAEAECTVSAMCTVVELSLLPHTFMWPLMVMVPMARVLQCSISAAAMIVAWFWMAAHTRPHALTTRRVRHWWVTWKATSSMGSRMLVSRSAQGLKTWPPTLPSTISISIPLPVGHTGRLRAKVQWECVAAWCNWAGGFRMRTPAFLCKGCCKSNLLSPFHQK